MRGILPVLILVALPFLPPAEGLCQSGGDITSQQKKMHRLQQGIDTQKEMISRTGKKERTFLEELETIDGQLTGLEKEMTGLDQQLRTLAKELEAKQREYGAVAESKKQAGTRVEARLATYYRMGRIGLLNALFSARSLPELLSFEDSYGRLLRHDRQSFAEYRQRMEQLAAASKEIETRQKILAGVRDKVAEKRGLLDATRKERRNLLARVRTEKTLYLRALEEIEQAAGELQATIRKLKQQQETRQAAVAEKVPRQRQATAPESQKKPPELKGLQFAAQKGMLNPPVGGTVSTLFGTSKSGKFGIALVADGINIQAAARAAVKAIYHGRVVYAGVLRGYGNLLIIDHGDQYYSLISRVETFYPKVGDHVVSGETVATVGDRTGLIDEGIHFEIRHGTTPLNPMEWLNGKGLIIPTPPPR
ncbi:MAG: peptidoglycan DD-metalloendopeptidase family protein [Thermodesulfobacteriota bacterium]